MINFSLEEMEEAGTTAVVCNKCGFTGGQLLAEPKADSDSKCCCWAFDHPPCPVHPNATEDYKAAVNASEDSEGA